MQLLEQTLRLDHALGQLGRRRTDIRSGSGAGRRFHLLGGLLPLFEPHARLLLNGVEIVQPVRQPCLVLTPFLLGLVLGSFQNGAGGPARFLVGGLGGVFLGLLAFEDLALRQGVLPVGGVLLDLVVRLDADAGLLDLAVVLLPLGGEPAADRFAALGELDLDGVPLLLKRRRDGRLGAARSPAR